MSTSNVLSGRAWVFGDGIHNDSGITSIESTRNAIFDPTVLASTCLMAIRPDFTRNVAPGDIIVAGKQFGKGQLHIQGPLSIKGTGAGLICASMTRSFFRLSVSVGLRMLPFVPDILTRVHDGDQLEVDFRSGEVRNVTQGTTFSAEPLPDFLWEFIDAGGEREWLAKQPSLY